MEKRHLNAEWLDKADSANNPYVLVYKEDKITLTHTRCNKDINKAHLGFEAVKQHSEKGTHRIF